MTTIILPPDIEEPLAQAATKLGTTPELLALSSLRKLFGRPDGNEATTEKENLYDLLFGFLGTVDGSTEPWSENGGSRFAQGMAEKHRQGRL
jgi:hypothetical protein